MTDPFKNSGAKVNNHPCCVSPKGTVQRAAVFELEFEYSVARTCQLAPASTLPAHASARGLSDVVDGDAAVVAMAR